MTFALILFFFLFNKCSTAALFDIRAEDLSHTSWPLHNNDVRIQSPFCRKLNLQFSCSICCSLAFSPMDLQHCQRHSYCYPRLFCNSQTTGTDTHAFHCCIPEPYTRAAWDEQQPSCHSAWMDINGYLELENCKLCVCVTQACARVILRLKWSGQSGGEVTHK